MNRSAAAIGIGVLAIAAIVGVILFLQLPSPDAPPGPARPAATAPQAGGTPAAPAAGKPAGETAAAPSTAPVPAATGVPTFDVVRVDKKGNVVIAGKASPECVVTVRNGDAVVGTATADRRGDWVIVPGEPLAAGKANLSLDAKCGDAAPVEADRTVVVIVPERETAVAAAAQAGKSAGAPSATGRGGGEAGGAGTPAGAEVAERAAAETGGEAAGAVAGQGAPRPTEMAKAGEAGGSGAIAVAVPRDASKPAEVLQPSTASTGEGVAIDSVDYDDKGNVVVSGRAPPGSDVQVYLDNHSIGGAHTDSSGHWRLEPKQKVAPGEYALRADRLRADGTVVARAEIPFVRGEPLSDLPAGHVVVIKPGDYLWKIARASYGAGRRYTLIYDANRSQISDPDLIYPGQVFTLPRVN